MYSLLFSFFNQRYIYNSNENFNELAFWTDFEQESFKIPIRKISIALVKTPTIIIFVKTKFMPLKFYLDKRKNKYGESPIRIVWSFNGDRYQTTMGFSIPPKSWNEKECVVTPAAYNHKKTPTYLINDIIKQIRKAVNYIENYARSQNATLTKPIVKKVVSDVLSAGGKYPSDKVSAWHTMFSDICLNEDRYFEDQEAHQYKLIGFGKNSETKEDVVVYQSLHGSRKIWVCPYKTFFSSYIDKDGFLIERFIEITL